MAKSKFNAEQRAIVNGPVGRKARLLVRNIIWAENHRNHARDYLRDVNRGIAAFRNLGLLADVLFASANSINRNRTGTGELSFSDGDLMRNTLQLARSLHEQRRGVAGLIPKEGDGPLDHVRDFARIELRNAEDGLDASLWRSYRHYAENRDAYYDMARIEMEVAGKQYIGPDAQAATPAT
ncbi:MAG TPA: hypothetical protein VLG47_07775 [Candidatus Saccharimonadales bacterium]|nr:hypothetical protein [Candidatus Saccharimonadales bacterium]